MLVARGRPCYDIFMREHGKQKGVILKAYSKPSSVEIRCAFTLLQYFNSTIEFIPKATIHTPDLKVTSKNQLWEVKDIKGNSKNTIAHNLSSAKKQSENVIITLYSTKMTPKIAVARIKAELKHTPQIKKCLLITKEEKVVKIK